MGFEVDAAGRALILREEGEVLHIYNDFLGFPTACVGHLIKPGEDFSGKLSPERCDQVLDRDLAPIEKVLNDLIKVDQAQCEINALASWLFNCGSGALRTSQILSAINRGLEHDVPVLLEAWSKGRAAKGGPLVTIPVLLARRRREGALYAQAYRLVTPPAPPPEPQAELTDDELGYLNSLQFDLAEGAYEDYLAARRAAFDEKFA